MIFESKKNILNLKDKEWSSKNDLWILKNRVVISKNKISFHFNFFEFQKMKYEFQRLISNINLWIWKSWISKIKVRKMKIYFSSKWL